ncbi:hypothetical protein H8356DRAFT_1431786 [Neocallimastix lanati (nom. inval.)]|nr:hypothetical protein H8356DRAFT_1431786 [Neocallimastix sp. JGI-2020a]
MNNTFLFPKVDKLNESNYEIWKRRHEGILMSKDREIKICKKSMKGCKRVYSFTYNSLNSNIMEELKKDHDNTITKKLRYIIKVLLHEETTNKVIEDTTKAAKLFTYVHESQTTKNEDLIDYRLQPINEERDNNISFNKIKQDYEEVVDSIKTIEEESRIEVSKEIIKQHDYSKKAKLYLLSIRKSITKIKKIGNFSTCNNNITTRKLHLIKTSLNLWQRRLGHYYHEDLTKYLNLHNKRNKENEVHTNLSIKRLASSTDEHISIHAIIRNNDREALDITMDIPLNF